MEAGLLVVAKKHLLQGFQRNADMLSQLSTLEVLLNDIYGSRQPNTDDYDNRRDLIRIVNEIAKEIYGKSKECPVVESFGSYLMDMFSAKSDLDLSIKFSDKKAEASRDAKIKALRKFAEKFYVLQKKKHVTNVKPILSARVPVLKVTDCGTGIECDLSVGNLDGIAKSHIILMISSIDDRFKKLCFLMKAWAKAHDINSSKDGTLNSLSLILLVAFHLQSRERPILPPFSAIFKDGAVPEAVQKNIPSFLNYGNGNKESIADLFVSLLVMLESAETLWPMGLCVSTYEGSWIYRTWQSKKEDKIGLISIEDFTDRSQNTARAVKSKNIIKIYSCIRRSVQQIRSFINGKIDAEKLKNRLFGPDSQTENEGFEDIAHPAQQPNFEDPTQRKRKRSKQTQEKKKLNKLYGSSLGRTHAQLPLHSNLLKKKEAKLFKQPDGTFVGGTWAQAPINSNPPLQISVGFRYERSHAEIWRYPTPNLHHPLASSSGSSMPYHPTPCLPPVQYAPHRGFERSYIPSQSLSSAPFHAPDTRNYRAHGSYTKPVETNHHRNPMVGSDAYPRFFYRLP